MKNSLISAMFELNFYEHTSMAFNEVEFDKLEMGLQLQWSKFTTNILQPKLKKTEFKVIWHKAML